MWNSGSCLGAVWAMGGDVRGLHHSGAATGIRRTEAGDAAEHAAVRGQRPAVRCSEQPAAENPSGEQVISRLTGPSQTVIELNATLN